MEVRGGCHRETLDGLMGVGEGYTVHGADGVGYGVPGDVGADIREWEDASEHKHGDRP